jgi:elongation factor G
MSERARDSLRNVILISSAGAGKTSLAEAMLFASGVVPHLGSITQGTDIVPSAPVSSAVPGSTPLSISLILPERWPCSVRR